MRIALAHSHPNTFGGGERALLELARGLASHHQVRLLLGAYDAAQTYAELAAFPRVRLSGFHWLASGVSDDAVVANSFGANLLALRNGPRVVYWVHSVRSRFLLPGASRADLVLRRAIDWLAVRRDARLVANSRHTAARLLQLYGRPADAVVYPGVDLDCFSPGSSTGDVAVTVGRVAPEKGLDRLLRFWREIPDLPLHVIGDGEADFVEWLRAQAPGNVVFRGALAPHELLAAYRRARVAVFTPYAEEFGIAPLEAMACAVPVVAWREGGLTETVVDDETGYLVADEETFRQRVRLLWRDERLRRRHGAAARARAEQFGWAHCVAGMERLCREVARPVPESPSREEF